MPMRRRVSALIFVFTLPCLWAGAAPPEGSRPSGRVRLAVLLIFDQMRGDYLERWRPLFGPGGFRRLEDQGAWFTNCHYPYADTYTGAGHASVATGCAPDVHGIIGNFWYDRAARQYVTAAGTDRYTPVPPRLATSSKERGSYSPDRLRAPTLADSLKDATGARGRVVALSFKDRSAALPGGRRPDACYWFSDPSGSFETSTYYRDTPHPWVAAFNRSGAARHWLGTPWTRLRPDLDYDRYCDPDDAPGEGVGSGQGRTFPHPTGGGSSSTATYYKALYNSPYGNELLLDLVCRAVEAEELGKHDDPDLLCVSFSCNDPVGHCWGPDSQEVFDVTLRSDRLLARLLDFLDARLGRDGYAVALTSDHGVCPNPEASRRKGHHAGRIAPTLLSREADRFLREKFGGGAKERWVEATAEGWVYLDHDTVARHGLQSADVETALAGWLKTQPGIETAFTRSQLTGPTPPDDPIGRRVRRSFFPERSGDVGAVPRPYYLITSFTTGTTHGTPHVYDTHVPLLVYGPGVEPGVRRDEVQPLAAPAILARLLGVPAPAKAAAPVPPGLFKDR
jgi:arylsulfatase A-like enzyme